MPGLPPCAVCGEPTSGKLGVCPRTTACRSEYTRLNRYAKAGQVAPPRPISHPCTLCGKPTTSPSGVCSRGACKTEWQRQKIAADTGHTRTPYVYGECELCGRRCRAELGVCQETPSCQTEYNRRFRVSHREHLRAYKRQDRVANLERERARDRQRYIDNREARLASGRRIRLGQPDVVAAQNRRYREANRDALREKHHKYMARTDRPCRRAASGCTEFALPGRCYCREHARASEREKRAIKRQHLAEAQDWMCPWCDLPLPADLAGTEVDHIIPVARGGPDAKWNYQILHRRCNRAKWHRVTDQALALATEHGIVLTDAEAA